LAIGGGSIDAGTVGMSNPQGLAEGNVGIGLNGKLGDSGVVIDGDLYLANGASASFSGSADVTGTIHLDAAANALLEQANKDARAAAAAAAALPSSDGGLGLTEITTGGTLQPGVYNLTKFELGGNEYLTLAAGGSYVFNISGSMKIGGGDGEGVLLAPGLSEADVLFNITGTTAVAFSGGGNAAVLHGILLAPDANINLSPGLVIGEIIGGENIQIVSGAKLHGITPPTVPDAGSTMLLMSMGLGCLAAVKRKFVS
jgi:choice-of-anchor A domain-containing protein